MRKKILVLQFRTDESTKHEQECFYDEYSDYDLDLDFKNVVQEDVPTSVVDKYRGIILGGSGEFYLAQGDNQKGWLQQTYNLLDKAFDNSVHVLGICLGAQIIALHQGSNITDDSKYHETGSYEISLSNDADKCDIFSDLDKEFHAPLCHEDTPINQKI
jgi:GMP synthase-like glutamine amidotransferase